MLEAIANSTSDIGLTPIVRSMVLDRQNSTGVRSAAAKAYSNCVKADWPTIEALDKELAARTDDMAVSEVRLALFHLSKRSGNLPARLLSIMEQAVSLKGVRRAIGHFSRLRDVPTDPDLDLLLDGAPRVISANETEDFEIRSLFDAWLGRRLESTAAITPIQLAHWLRDTRSSRLRGRTQIQAALKARLANDAPPFEATYECLANEMPNEKRSFWLFVFSDLWQMLPLAVWPVQPAGFFLRHAEKEADPLRAADLFRMYLLWFPKEGGSAELAEAGFVFIEGRTDVAAVLGEWNICPIDNWRVKQSETVEEEARQKAANRAQNIAHFTARITAIREGREENALVWAAAIYLGLFCDVDRDVGPRERLVSFCSEETADALIEDASNIRRNLTFRLRTKLSGAGALIAFRLRTPYSACRSSCDIGRAWECRMQHCPNASRSR